MSRYLEMFLLGRFEVRLDGQPVPIDSRPVQSLLTYLALHPNIDHRREKLAGVIWPDSGEASARANLRQALWRLRQAIGDDHLQVESESLRLTTGPSCRVDAVVLDADIGDLDLDAYRGELLPGVYDDWVVLERDRLESVYQRRVQAAVGDLVRQGRWSEVLRSAEAWVARGQVPEPAYRALMTAHAALGDLGAMAQAYQRCVDALRSDLGVDASQETQELFRKLRSGERTPAAAAATSEGTLAAGNLPAQTNTFIGRETEIEAIREQLTRPETRLLTLTGPGGTGKTRLAIRVASSLQGQFEHGVRFVDLESLSEASRVASAIAVALGVRERGEIPVQEALGALLRQRQLLIVLDNFEHVIEAAPLVGQLLAVAPGVKFLVTSRESLQIYGESEFSVAPLPLPAIQTSASAASVAKSDSVRLFVERARAARPDWELTNENAAAIAEICRRVDGLPLALELAAARVRIFPPEELLARLESRLGTLTAGPRDVPDRQRTLRGTIAWSYDHLEEPDRTLFARLSVFAGGATLFAAEAVCAEAGQADFPDALLSLVNKSLIRQEPGSEGGVRYRMLETLREFAIERLQESGAEGEIRERHAGYFADWMEEAASWMDGPHQLVWLDRMQADHDNLRAALKWALESGAVELGLRLAGAAAPLWVVRGHLQEGYDTSRALLERAVGAPASLPLARTTIGAARLAYRQNNLEAAERLYATALELFRKLGDVRGAASSLIGIGMSETERGEYRVAPKRFAQALGEHRSVGDHSGEGNALINLGWTAMRAGDYGPAKEYLHDGLAAYQRAGDAVGVAFTYSGLGELYLRTGDLDQASRFLQDSLQARRALGDKWGMGATLGSMGWAALEGGDAASAAARLKESLRLRNELGEKGGMAWCLEKMAEVAAATDASDRAVTLYGGAAELRSSIGSSIDPADQAAHQQRLASLREQLGEAEFESAWRRGVQLTLPDLILYAYETGPGG